MLPSSRGALYFSLLVKKLQPAIFTAKFFLNNSSKFYSQQHYSKQPSVDSSKTNDPLSTTVFNTMIQYLNSQYFSKMINLFSAHHSAAKDASWIKVYELVILAHFKLNQFEQAKKLYAEFRSVFPDEPLKISTYTIITKAISKSHVFADANVEELRLVLDDVKKFEIQTDAKFFGSYLHACNQLHFPTETIRIFKEEILPLPKHNRNSTLYVFVLQAVVSKFDIETGKLVLEQIEKDGIAIESDEFLKQQIFHFNSLLDPSHIINRFVPIVDNLASATPEKLKQYQVEVFITLDRASDINAVELLVDYFHKNNATQLMTKGAWDKVVDKLGKNNMHKFALETVTNMRKIPNFQPDEYTFMSLYHNIFNSYLYQGVTYIFLVEYVKLVDSLMKEYGVPEGDIVTFVKSKVLCALVTNPATIYTYYCNITQGKDLNFKLNVICNIFSALVHMHRDRITVLLWDKLYENDRLKDFETSKQFGGVMISHFKMIRRVDKLIQLKQMLLKKRLTLWERDVNRLEEAIATLQAEPYATQNEEQDYQSATTETEKIN